MPPISTACILIGDSIIVGLRVFFPDCTFIAAVGVNTPTMTRRLQEHPALNGAQWPLAVVSLGSNDKAGFVLRQNLTILRRHLPAYNIVFVKPALPAQGADVAAIAKDWDFPLVSFVPAKDGVHPQSYALLARDIKALPIWRHIGEQR